MRGKHFCVYFRNHFIRSSSIPCTWSRSFLQHFSSNSLAFFIFLEKCTSAHMYAHAHICTVYVLHPSSLFLQLLQTFAFTFFTPINDLFEFAVSTPGIQVKTTFSIPMSWMSWWTRSASRKCHSTIFSEKYMDLVK